MIMSEQISELAGALAKAQALIDGAEKDGKNSHFNSKYSSLSSVWEACRIPLTSNGLSVCQALSSEDGKVKCTTILLHSSGQFIKSEFSMTPQQNTPQAAGSCATYLRRYSLQAIVGVAPDDDDGNAASQRPQIPEKQSPAGFDPKNTEHVKAISSKLDAMGVRGSWRTDVLKAMSGKSMQDLSSVVALCNPEAPDTKE